MVTPPINTMQAFDTYYGGSGNTSKHGSNGPSTFQIFLISGIILTGACAIYFAVQNKDLKKRVKPFKQLS